MPAFIVTVDAGQLTHAPTSSTLTTPVSSFTSCRKMSPPSAWTAGRITSMVAATCSLTLASVRGACEPQTVVLAHQGGWDEALIVLAPMLVFFGLLLVANRRAARMEQTERAEEAEPAERPEEELAD